MVIYNRKISLKIQDKIEEYNFHYRKKYIMIYLKLKNFYLIILL
jgi:hypothetical protein